MIFWIIYFALSFLISFLLSMLLEKRYLKFILFFVSFGILSAIWFRSPGESEIAPIISILFLENSILDSQGIMRLIRPLSLFVVIGIIFSGILWFFKSKN